MSTGKFVQGSTLRHVLVMTGTATVGLMAVFLVDLTDVFFLSLLGGLETAAVGFGFAIVFFNLSVCIGLSIAAGALVSRALGAGDMARARRCAVNVAATGLLITVPMAGLVMLVSPWLLRLLGADGEAYELAMAYLWVLVPSLPLLALALIAAGVLRAAGDARRGMYATLAGAITNGAFDPLLIFGLDLGIQGAAWATVLGRLAILGYAGWMVVREHRLVAGFERPAFLADLRPVLAIALPAIFTNIATPIGQAYVTGVIARFGDSAVAGNAVVGRLLPVAFAALFAMSGAVGPIIGQNLGAGRLDRVRRTLRDALASALVITLLVSLLLWLAQDWIVAGFGLSGDGAELVRVFCGWVAPLFVFTGATFITNATFNNLGYAFLSTGFNFGKATLGTMPFVAVGAWWLGAPGALLGQAVGAVLVGVAGVWVAFRLIGRLERGRSELAVAPAG